MKRSMSFTSQTGERKNQEQVRSRGEPLRVAEGRVNAFPSAAGETSSRLDSAQSTNTFPVPPGLALSSTLLTLAP